MTLDKIMIPHQKRKIQLMKAGNLSAYLLKV